MAARKTPRVLTNKTCKEITALILGYVNEQLRPRVKRNFQRHLRSCPDCVNFLNTYKKTATLTRSIRPEEIPIRVRNSILDFLREQIRKSSSRS
jgi:Putative zinc-finger